jgi:hypothetical protein
MTTQNNKGCDSGKSAAPKAKPTRDYRWNSTKSQCARLLAALMRGPVTTIEARRDLDILAPAPRVHTLRHQHGKNIVTTWIDELTSDGGVLHRVARYVLIDDQSDLLGGAV